MNCFSDSVGQLFLHIVQISELISTAEIPYFSATFMQTPRLLSWIFCTSLGHLCHFKLVHPPMIFYSENSLHHSFLHVPQLWELMLQKFHIFPGFLYRHHSCYHEYSTCPQDIYGTCIISMGHCILQILHLSHPEYSTHFQDFYDICTWPWNIVTAVSHPCIQCSRSFHCLYTRHLCPGHFVFQTFHR